MGLFRDGIFLVELRGKISISIVQTTGLPLKCGLKCEASDLSRVVQVSPLGTSEQEPI